VIGKKSERDGRCADRDAAEEKDGSPLPAAGRDFDPPHMPAGKLESHG